MTESEYLELLPDSIDPYEFEERAAIIEYYDNKTRAEAEKIAFKMLINELTT
jgi:hypothetical protein